MSGFKKGSHTFPIACLLSLSLMTISANANPTSAETPQDFASHLIAKILTLPNNLNTRLEFASRVFIGKPYLKGGPLGEGADGDFDQDPLYRFDGFDCTTFVETTLALAESQNFADFLQRLNHVRYDQGQISFTNRNHFVELDWNPHNIEAGFFADITETLGSDTDHAVAVQNFSKQQWYASLPASEIKLPSASPEALQSKLAELHHAADNIADVTSRLPYLKKAALLKLKDSLPVPAVLNIVRVVPSADSSGPITEVTHQVLFVRVNGNLRIRAASSKQTFMRVVDLSFENYVNSLVQSPSTLGVNFLQVL